MTGLLHRHGDRIDDVLELLYEHPALARTLNGEVSYLQAEAVLALCAQRGR